MSRLRFGAALIAERAGEPYQCRRLPAGVARYRAEGDLVGIVERMGGDLRQPHGQRIAAMGQ